MQIIPVNIIEINNYPFLDISTMKITPIVPITPIILEKIKTFISS